MQLLFLSLLLDPFVLPKQLLIIVVAIVLGFRVNSRFLLLLILAVFFDEGL
jgi:uncharacterized membrane protein YwzB